MKLTTAQANKTLKSNKQLSSVFKLKKLIQNAANTKIVSNKQNIETMNTLASQSGINKSQKLPKSISRGKFIVPKAERSESKVSDKSNKTGKSGNHKKLQLTNLNLEKMKINPVVCSVKSSKSINIPTINSYLAKSTSNKTINNKKIQCLNKSYKGFSFHQKEQLTIDSFYIGKKLGRGRFGNVYAAQEKETNFLLAIKIINKQQLKQAEMQEQLISEIKLQMFMKHPNILKMYGYFHDDRNIYLLLQLAEQCLFRNLRHKTCFSEKDVAYYTKQLIEGLKYIHGQNIIHRDLKPQNIMLVNNVLKLADFGWSVYSPLYKRQTFCGTLDYVPPEIVNGEYYDERVDLWSLGILIYELTFGYAPFEGCRSEQQTFEKILKGEFEIPQTVSKQLKKVIKYTLIKDPKQRLKLSDIQQSTWLKSHEKEGRNICEQIWNFWQSHRQK